MDKGDGGAGAWDFKEKAGSFQVGEGEETCGKVLPGPLRDGETQGILTNKLCGTPPSGMFSLLCDVKVMLPVKVKQVFHLDFFSQVRGRVKVAFCVFCFLITILKTIPQKVYFGVAKL